MRRPALRSALAAALVVPAALGLTGAEAAPSDPAGQDSTTPNVAAQVYYGHEIVQPGGTDTMSIDLVNNGPSNLDDSTRLALDVSLPHDTTTDGTVVEYIPGNAPSGRNAVPSEHFRPASSVFAAGPNGSLEATFAAGSYGNGKTFRSYTLTVHIDKDVTSGSQLDGGGVTVTMQNYVHLTLAENPPTVASPPTGSSTPKPLPKPKPKPRSGWHASPNCPAGGGSGSGNGGSGGSGGSSTCCSGGNGGSGNGSSNGGGWGKSMKHSCNGPRLADTGSTAGPTAAAGLAVLALGGVVLGAAGFARRRRSSAGRDRSA